MKGRLRARVAGELARLLLSDDPVEEFQAAAGGRED
jgi:hypothetical protein